MIEQRQTVTPAAGRSAKRLILITGVIIALGAAVAFGLFTPPCCRGAFGLFARDGGAPSEPPATVGSSSSADAPAVKTERVLVGIEGMSCTSCASGIQAMLKRTPGVVSAEVSFARKEANVEYDSARTSPEKIVEAINNTGYTASVKG